MAGLLLMPDVIMGQIYYGMPGTGIMRIDSDLQKQEIISLPDELTPLNFHGTKVGEFDGDRRLFLPANNDEMVVVLTLDGEVDFTLPRPIFDEYQAEDSVYKPTDTVLVGNRLYIADGYGSNYIISADVNTRQWTGISVARLKTAKKTVNLRRPTASTSIQLITT